jgi:LPXTG-motif cell wall-anchored protein
MSMPVRRTAAAAAVVLCAAWAPAAVAQDPGRPFEEPVLEGEIPTATATADPTETAEPTATPTAEPTATATATSGPGGKANLPATGSDPLQVVLIGLSLLGFGLSLRFRVALADARPRD